MAITTKDHTGNGTVTDYSFPFPYIKQSDIKVTLDNVVKEEGTTKITHLLMLQQLDSMTLQPMALLLKFTELQMIVNSLPPSTLSQLLDQMI